MGLFDKNKEKGSIQVNPVSDNVYQCYTGWGWFMNRHKKPYYKMLLWTILDQIFRGLNNVQFINTRKPNFEIDAIISFLESNFVLLLDQLWTLGYMAIQGDKNLNFRLIPVDDIRKDSKGRVINKNSIVVYSPHYQSDRETDFQIIKPWLDIVDSLGNTLREGTEHMNVLPIISGESIPANQEFKEELSMLMGRDYGASGQKFPYFLSKVPLDVKTIDLNIKDLEIDKNLLEAFKYLCRFFGVPTDLIVGGATFSNTNDAIQHFYNTTIRNYAEVLLQLGRSIITSCTNLPKSSLNYKIYNVPGMEKALTDSLKEKEAYIDLLLKMKNAGMDVEADLAKAYEDVKRAYVES